MLQKLLFIAAFYLMFGFKSQAQNSSLSFNGTADYVQVPNSNQLNFSTNFTAEAWVQLDKTNGQNIIFSKAWCGISQFAYNLSILDGKLRWAWNIDGNCNFTSLEESNNVVFQNGECHHIAVVHSSSNVLLYVDGQIVPSSLVQGNYSGIMSSSEPLRMGIYRGLSGSFMYFMDGQLDELKFWSVTRSTQEINYSMLNVLSGNEANLVAYYDFENLVAGSYITVPNKASATGNTLDAESSATSPIIVGSCAQLSSIQEGSLPSEFNALQIAPNPAFNSIKVSVHLVLNQSTLYIFDAFGKEIITQPFSGLQTDINVSSLSKGIYYLKCDQLEGQVYKFVKN
jgi:hypothetical protein